MNLPDRDAMTCTLPDGVPVVLAAIGPEDEHRIREGFRGLSERSKYWRYFRESAELTEADVAGLIGADQVSHVAWGARDPTREGEPGLGLARLIRDAADPFSAELAVVVLDASQKRGIGTLLLAAVALRADELGLRVIRATALPENDVLSHWLRGLGAAMTYDGQVCRFRLDVAALVGTPAPSPEETHPVSSEEAPRPTGRDRREKKKKDRKTAPAPVPVPMVSASASWFHQAVEELRPHFGREEARAS
jgi:GNAT superfamily N-acetyltransferase